MTAVEPTQDPDALARRVAEVFDRRVKSVLRPEDDGKYIALDLSSGEYEVDADDYAAVARLRLRCPQADIWIERAGQPTAYKIRCGR
jgi:hypothetical protein